MDSNEALRTPTKTEPSKQESTTTWMGTANIPRFDNHLPGRFEHSQLRKIYQRSGPELTTRLPIKMDANGYRLPSHSLFQLTGGNHQKKWPWGDENPPGLGAPNTLISPNMSGPPPGGKLYLRITRYARQPNGYGLRASSEASPNGLKMLGDDRRIWQCPVSKHQPWWFLHGSRGWSWRNDRNLWSL